MDTMRNTINNPHDFSRCHCGGEYSLPVPTPQEKAQDLHPSRCTACNAFRYLSDKEYEQAQERTKAR
jgi:hypothetical protein